MIDFFNRHWRGIDAIAIMALTAYIVIDAQRAHRLKPTPPTRRALKWSVVAMVACAIRLYLGGAEIFAPFRHAHFMLYELIGLPFVVLSVAALVICGRSQSQR